MKTSTISRSEVMKALGKWKLSLKSLSLKS
jgi:hypothetical protein